jgi:N-acetylmuramoyl-L-alanine amidase
MTRSNDSFIKLRNRTKFANKKNADLFISIHANSIPKTSNIHKAYGIECYFLSTARSGRAKNVAAKENSSDIKDLDYYGKQNFLSIMNNGKIVASHKLAIDLQRSMMSQMRKKYNKIKDGGVREGPFWVLVGAQMPAVLVEIGFISNPMEAKRMVSNQYQDNLAKGLADGIERYFSKNN